MEELLKKAKINDVALKRLIVQTVARNLSALVEPCYYPEVKKHFYDILKLTGLTEKDIKEFTKRRWRGRKEAKFAIHNDPIANFYVFLMQYFLKNRDKTSYTHLMFFYNIRQYANLMHKSFTYCNADVFRQALEVLTKTHLFAREKTIPNALTFISGDMIRIWTRALASNDPEGISRFMQDSRTRISQSMKSFAQTYYKVHDEGSAMKTADDSTTDDEDNKSQDRVAEKGTRLADEITKKITVYRYIDRKSQEEARRIAKINSSIATQIVSKLNNTKYSDNLRIIYKIFLKDIPNANSLCGKQFEKHVRGLMSIKRTNSSLYFKQQINVLLMNVLEDIDLKVAYGKLTNQTQFHINLFLGYYLTMILRNSVC